MAQRDNGCPGITKNVRYIIELENNQHLAERLKVLMDELKKDEYVLKTLDKKDENRYIVEFESTKEGLK